MHEQLWKKTGSCLILAKTSVVILEFQQNF